MLMSEKNENEPVWEYVPLDEYKPPADTVQRTVTTRLSTFLRRLGVPEKKKEAAKEKEADLQALPQKILKAAAPEPAWRDAAAALHQALRKTFSEQRDCAAAVVVGAPFSGHAEALVTLANAAGWPIVPPPSLQQVLEADLEWVDSLAQTSSPWVVPLLEKSFLRHERGLALVRRLMADSVSGRLGRGIIGCGSWAWAYLQQVSAETDVFSALSAQAMDAWRLQRWFSGIAPKDSQGRGFRFKPAGEATELLSSSLSAQGDAKESISRLFTPLAAYSRGIAGVALSIWRSSLRRTPQKTGAGSKGTDPADVIRVKPLGEVALPSVPSLDRPAGAFVLLTILIHNGLPEKVLDKLLPVGADQITKALLRLRSAGVVEQRNTVWRVAPLAYPAVRSYLRDENYLTDCL
jgi:hypothetical protein